MQPDPQETADLVTFTEEILNGKLRFLAVFAALRWLKSFIKRGHKVFFKVFFKVFLVIIKFMNIIE